MRIGRGIPTIWPANQVLSRYLRPGTLEDLAGAFSRIAEDPPNLKSLGISRMTSPEVLDELRRFYNLST
jgi:hypothetical protein